MVAIWPGSATYASHRSSSGSSHQLPSLFNQSIHEKHKEHRQFKMRERERETASHTNHQRTTALPITRGFLLSLPQSNETLCFAKDPRMPRMLPEEATLRGGVVGHHKGLLHPRPLEEQTPSQIHRCRERALSRIESFALDIINISQNIS